MAKDWSIKKALFILISSTVFTLVFSGAIFHFYQKRRNERLSLEKYQITSIIQTGPEKEVLKTNYLAQLLNLSVDEPISLYAFDIKEAEKSLKASPLIKEAKIKRLPPSTLYIDYEVYKPVAKLADFLNTGIDRSGHIFPLEPFFSPKKLPEVFLGIDRPKEWEVKGPYLDLALDILSFLETVPWKEGLYIQKIDVSKAFAKSLGQREVVLCTEEEVFFQKEEGEIVCTFPKMIRLCPKNYQQQLNNFLVLRKEMIKDYKRQVAGLSSGGRFAVCIIDLRIPQLAFVEKGSS